MQAGFSNLIRPSSCPFEWSASRHSLAGWFSFSSTQLSQSWAVVGSGGIPGIPWKRPHPAAFCVQRSASFGRNTKQHPYVLCSVCTPAIPLLTIYFWKINDSEPKSIWIIARNRNEINLIRIGWCLFRLKQMRNGGLWKSPLLDSNFSNDTGAVYGNSLEGILSTPFTWNRSQLFIFFFVGFNLWQTRWSLID